MSWVSEYLSRTPVQWTIFGTFLALIALLLLLRKPNTLLLSSGKTGELHISRHALHRLLETCCEQVRGVASARASVRRSGGKFYTSLRLKIRPDAKLDAIQGYLTEEIASIYRENLGLKVEAGPIRVKVEGVIPRDEGFSS